MAPTRRVQLTWFGLRTKQNVGSVGFLASEWTVVGLRRENWQESSISGIHRRGRVRPDPGRLPGFRVNSHLPPTGDHFRRLVCRGVVGHRRTPNYRIKGRCRPYIGSPTQYPTLMGPETNGRTRFAHTRFSFVAETAISGCDAGTNPEYSGLMGPETGLRARM